MAKLDETSEQKNLPLRDIKQLGLCFSCNDVDICVSKKTWKGPIMFCEEFNDHINIPHEADEEKPEAISNGGERSSSTRNGAAVKRLGLCVNCLHVNTCAFPVVEGGVWHCEEYE